MALLAVFGTVTRCQADLRAGPAIAAWLDELVALIGMTPVGAPMIEQFAHWEGGPAPSVVRMLDDGLQGGVTVTRPVAESAVLAHTYPETSQLEVQIDSCNDIPNHVEVATAIRDRWGLKVPPGGIVWLPGWGWKRLRDHTRYVDDNWPYMMEALTHYTVVSPLLQKPAGVPREAAVNLIP